jgi:uncharacterized protein with PQ loop repeat
MVHNVLAVTASAWGVVMGLAPVLQIRRILRQHSSRDISLGYLAVLLAGFALWIAYGAAAGNPALVIPNSVALLNGTALVITVRRLRGHGHRHFLRAARRRGRTPAATRPS